MSVPKSEHAQQSPSERPHNPSDDLSTFASISRLYPYLRPALPRITLGMVAALLASVVSLTIPIVLQHLVDGTLLHRGGSREAVVWAALAILALGAAEAVLYSLRRWFVLQPGTRVEAALRNGLYSKLQNLPVSFHDKWPSGQLLSRAVGDLNLIRRWLSFGIVLFVELVFVFGAWVVAPEVAATAAAPMPPLAQVANRQALGALIYTRYIYAFEASGVILLVAMIGAIVLTLRAREGVRRQSIAAQVARRRKETIEVVKVRSREGV